MFRLGLRGKCTYRSFNRQLEIDFRPDRSSGSSHANQRNQHHTTAQAHTIHLVGVKPQTPNPKPYWPWQKTNFKLLPKYGFSIFLHSIMILFLHKWARAFLLSKYMILNYMFRLGLRGKCTYRSFNRQLEIDFRPDTVPALANCETVTFPKIRIFDISSQNRYLIT